ncbi:hypothetical protein, partial [Vibrio parahaemolyticus]|uniref:hypothetical protein n=1 Tax=Vibrio parahaemolyticus TaxID=670 RepID=UPI0011685446
KLKSCFGPIWSNRNSSVGTKKWIISLTDPAIEAPRKLEETIEQDAALSFMMHFVILSTISNVNQRNLDGSDNNFVALKTPLASNGVD